MRVRQHALSLAFAAAFLLALAGQSVAGYFAFAEEQAAHGAPSGDWFSFVASSDFVVDVAENWQSEFLQFFLFIFATVWLVQKGSPESKKPGAEGRGTDEDQLVGAFAREDSPLWARARGLKLWIYSNSLLLTMGTIFVLSWALQAAAGYVVHNEEQSRHGLPGLDFGGYLLAPEFWNRTLQNWQSELLAVGCMVAFSIFLRQRGSPESKPVGMSHDRTAEESS